MENTKMKITNSNQFSKLLEELEKNPHLARGFRRGSVPKDFKEQWERVSEVLNALGPPERSCDGWQKVWRDIKCKVNKKLVNNKAECASTECRISKQLALSPLEKAVANLLQFQKQINTERAVHGLQSQGQNHECDLEDPAFETSGSFVLADMPEQPESESQQHIQMENPKIKITNTNQFNKLVEELEKNPILAKGFRKGTVPKDFKEQWESVSKVLNALGPPTRSCDGWQKVWRDLKCKVNRKLVNNKAECTATEGEIFKQLTLSPLEKAVANLLQFQRQINPEGAVHGVQFQGQHQEFQLEDITFESADSFVLANVLEQPENESRQQRKMENPKMKITNSNQFHKLLEELEKNPHLARGFRRGSVPKDFKEQWESISDVLNALGPPERCCYGWQKVWRDLKCKVNKKLLNNETECTTTGGGMSKSLSPLEKAVANLLQSQKQINHDGAVQGVQCQRQHQEFEHEDTAFETNDNFVLLNVHESPESESRQLEPATSSTRNDNGITLKTMPNTPMSNYNSHYEMLQKFSREQANILKNMKNSMSSVKRSLKDLNDCQKKLLDIEAKKLKLRILS
uniref:Regulatory protein zeste n=1 Tax=Musca domestica TaxID=7370 RepID=A0A1I8N660_MUSDO